MKHLIQKAVILFYLVLFQNILNAHSIQIYKNSYAKIIEHTKMSQEEVRYYKNLINCSDLYLVEKFKRIAVKNNKNIPIPVNCALYQIVKTNTGRVTLSNIMAKIMNIQNMVKILENNILHQNLDLQSVQSIINNINEEYQQLPDGNNQLLIKKICTKLKNKIYKYKITFCTGDNCYDPTTNTISITNDDQDIFIRIMSNKLMCSKNTNIKTQKIKSTSDERLYHELIHYLHYNFGEDILNANKYVMMRNTNGRIRALHATAIECSNLIQNTFMEDYNESSISEFFTITGIFFYLDDNNYKMGYFLQNENQYRVEACKQIRISHGGICKYIPKWFADLLGNIYIL